MEKNEILKQFNSLCSKFKNSKEELIQFSKEHNIDCLNCKYFFHAGHEPCKRRFIRLNQDVLIPLCFEFPED